MRLEEDGSATDPAAYLAAARSNVDWMGAWRQWPGRVGLGLGDSPLGEWCGRRVSVGGAWVWEGRGCGETCWRMGWQAL